jgi:hypothetical protein
MATFGNKLVTHQMKWNANMTDLNHLGMALKAQPHKMMGVMDQLFSAKNYYSGNALSSILMGNSKTEKKIGQNSWEWELKGANTRPLVILENVLNSAITMPGKMRTTFTIKLDEPWYLPSDVIMPGDHKYQVRIQDHAQPHGDGWIYTVRLMNDDPQAFLPLRFLEPGAQWVKLYAQSAEANEQRGSTIFSTPLGLQNRMGKFSKQYKITDYASTEVLAVGIADSNGKLHQSWIKFAEIEYWMQWYQELERSRWYSRSTDTVLDANGRPLFSGPGVEEQLEDSHKARYTHLTAKFAEEYLMDIYYGRVKPGQGRNVKGFAGEYAMLNWHRALDDWSQKSGFVRNVETFTNKVKSEYHNNALSVGYKMVRYEMANGSSLELVHNPVYDDRSLNFEIDPVTGYPYESQKITFLDFSGDNGTSNVELMKRENSEAFTYVNGLFGPTGPKSGGQSSHGGSYYEMHVEQVSGIHIKDITKCGQLEVDRNY